MSSHLPESDWRIFKELHPLMLERFSSAILEELETVIQDGNSSAHERYLKLYQLIHERDKEMARAFNDLRRSTALFQLGLLRRMKLLTDDELSQFSESTRTRIADLASW